MLIERIWQQTEWAPDQVYTITGTVVMIVQKFSFE